MILGKGSTLTTPPALHWGIGRGSILTTPPASHWGILGEGFPLHLCLPVSLLTSLAYSVIGVASLLCGTLRRQEGWHRLRGLAWGLQLLTCYK